ncbi:hypothetical protein HZA41_00295 [Candidatus Peregrinibacteria bacterium]|nr:hypothetical protein [Candidatus Peregrinibacteria bacterium]
MQNASELRTNEWLRDEAKSLWKNFFTDAPKKNMITVQFGRPAKARLGSIRLTRKKKSKVIMNGLFRSTHVPQQVVQGILAHEFTHYIQGFGSELPKLSLHPHRCRLVDEEMERRGLGEILEFQKKWIKAHWENVVKKNLPRKAKKHIRRRTRSSFFQRQIRSFLKTR